MLKNSALPKLAYSVEEVGDMLTVCRSKVYDEINAGRLRRTKFGRRTLIMKEDLEAFKASLRSANDEGDDAFRHVPSVTSRPADVI